MFSMGCREMLCLCNAFLMEPEPCNDQQENKCMLGIISTEWFRFEDYDKYRMIMEFVCLPKSSSDEAKWFLKRNFKL